MQESSWHYLFTIHAVYLPPEWEEGYVQQVVIELVNHGQVSASDLWICLAGILEARVWVQVEFVQAGKRVEIDAPLVDAIGRFCGVCRLGWAQMVAQPAVPDDYASFIL